MTQQQQVFKNFEEFWHHTRELSERQRDIIFHTLPSNQQERLRRSFRSDGWEDLFLRNEIDELIEDLRIELGFDVIYMRCRVLMGKSYYMKREVWEYLTSIFSNYPDEHSFYAIGGLVAQDVNEEAVLIVSDTTK